MKLDVVDVENVCTFLFLFLMGLPHDNVVFQLFMQKKIIIGIHYFAFFAFNLHPKIIRPVLGHMYYE
jgi:hypothetical protein